MTSVGWDDAKTAAGGGGRTIERIKLQKGKKVKIRLVGSLLPRYQYWVVDKDGGKKTIECLSFDRATQAFNNSEKNPIDEIPEGILTDDEKKPQFAYAAQCFDRDDGNKLKLFDLKPTVYKSIIGLVKNPEYGSPADPLKGYDLYIEGESTGPKAQNVKYVVTPGRSSSPLTEEELKTELFNLELLYKRPGYAEQKRWLLENTMYFSGVDFEATTEGVEDLKV